jgi:RNA polymerase sigma factor (sigma-70 family)
MAFVEERIVSSRPADTASAETANGKMEDMYNAHHKNIFFVCLRYGAGRRAWAEDATHGVFMKLVEHQGRFAEGDNIGGWLYRVAANVCLSRLRKERSFARRLLRVTQPVPDAVDRTVQDHEAACVAFAALDKLKPPERVVFCMKLFDGRSQREIAAALGFSEGYVSKLLARAWSEIEDAGWEVDDG